MHLYPQAFSYTLEFWADSIMQNQQNQQNIPTKSTKSIITYSYKAQQNQHSVQFHAFVGSGPQDLTNPYSPESSTKSYKIDYYIVVQSSTKSNKILQALAFCSISCICWEKK